MYQRNKITKKIYNKLFKYYNYENNIVVIREPKTFYFDFDWPKYVDRNLKHAIEFIAKSNESLAENKIKNEIEQLLSKYKQGNIIHEHGEQQNERTA